LRHGLGILHGAQGIESQFRLWVAAAQKVQPLF